MVIEVFRLDLVLTSNYMALKIVARDAQNTSDSIGIFAQGALSKSLTFLNICYEHLHVMLSKIKSQWFAKKKPVPQQVLSPRES